MDVKVNEDFYLNTCDYYSSQIQRIEEYLELFKTEYQDLFSSVDFGENLGMVLVGKCDGFYNGAKNSLSSLFEKVKAQTIDFLDDIEENDNLS